jgi:hypothetical protein
LRRGENPNKKRQSRAAQKNQKSAPVKSSGHRGNLNVKTKQMLLITNCNPINNNP